MTKLFITGATGYIGGDALYNIVQGYPDLVITALVRNPDKGAKVASQYPKIRLVYGTLDNTELLTEEASKADIILHCADCDHVASTESLVAGLAKKPQDAKSFLIHTSGTGILTWNDFERDTYGTAAEKVYDDWDGIKEVTSLPDYAIHRNVDKIILAASSKHPGISTAIVCPPCINGPGRGPDNQKSVQINRMAKAVLQRGKGFQVNEGTNRWTNVNVQDLSEAFFRLVEEAIKGGGSATWNAEGYYFTEDLEFYWGDVAKEVAKIAHKKGLIGTAEIDTIDKDEANKLAGYGAYLWGTNSRCRAIRAGKVLGWKPTHPGLFDSLPGIVDVEARDLGLTKSHAEKAAG